VKYEEPLLTNFSTVLTPEQAQLLKVRLTERAYLFRSVDYAHFGASSKPEKVNLTFYKSGKLFIQGKGTGEFVRFFLEPQIIKKATVGYEDIIDEKGDVDRMGVDESGKGDYFGPLVIASVFVAKGEAQPLRNMGVRDSKNITDKMAGILAAKIKKTQKHSLVVIGPEKYNDLYGKMKNLNRLLAWGHARAIENILDLVDCPKAISDQFGNKKLVENALLKKGRKIELVQMHKAESDMAVAAASIVARAEFLRRLRMLGEKYKIELCKGASTKTKELALKAVREHEEKEELLNKIAKLHFKTTEWIKSQNKLKGKPSQPEEGQTPEHDSTEKKSPDPVLNPKTFKHHEK